jgi:hypothetical protein
MLTMTWSFVQPWRVTRRVHADEMGSTSRGESNRYIADRSSRQVKTEEPLPEIEIPDVRRKPSLQLTTVLTFTPTAQVSILSLQIYIILSEILD